jgi:DNA ligase (NAD+)
MNEQISEQLKSLIEYLNARTAEYDAGHPTISDQEWDNKYFELICLEKSLGYTLTNSPTIKISYEIVNQLEKVEHPYKLLSLEKTKDINEVGAFLGTKDFLAMSKLDGLTCGLRYVNGRLVGAATRGNGIIGENILHNAKVIASIPNNIPYKGELFIGGEIICTYDDFNSFSSDYKNPRNFAAGSIRLLDANECANRKLTFVAWEVLHGLDEYNLLSERFKMLKSLGFITVPHVTSTIDNIVDLPHMILSISQAMSLPIDGVVFKFNDIEYGRSLGETAHHFKNAISFKFYDEVFPSKLQRIEWTMGRTGALTPVAVFDTVDMDGSEVSRASLHNVSIMEEIFQGTPFEGQKVNVYKANMIIPQIYDAEPDDEKTKAYLNFPHVCPVCGGEVQVINNDGVKVLMCLNSNCEGKLINRLDHFCGKKGLDIKGLSKATLEKLIEWGWVNTISDIMTLINYRTEWIQKPGFGQKSVDKILDAIENAKFTTLDAFISSLGIPLVGRTVAKELIKHISSYEEFRQKVDEYFDFSTYDGFADGKTNAILTFDFTEADKVFPYLYFKEREAQNANNMTCLNLKFVITGKLQMFKNRDAIKSVIEQHGGKVVDSVTKSTNYLINNDTESTSSKNKTAKQLGIPIISEKEFLEKFNLI